MLSLRPDRRRWSRRTRAVLRILNTRFPALATALFELLENQAIPRFSVFSASVAARWGAAWEERFGSLPWAIPLPDEVPESRVDAWLCDILREHPDVFSMLYIEYPAPLPSRPTSLEPLQHYLQPAPLGVDARAIKPSPANKTVQLADVERGWFEKHDDLKEKPRVRDYERLLNCRPRCRHATDYDDVAHGTAVLGIIAALKDDGYPATGIVPNLYKIYLSVTDDGSPHRAAGGSVANAILSAADELKEGDVLLIQEQTATRDGRLVPVEVLAAEAAAIRMVVDAGIVVIEPGGNGHTETDRSVDFDRFQYCGGYPLAPGRRGYFDSGAIVVSAVSSELPHRRLFFAPTGNRIDVLAPGEQVATTDVRPAEQKYESAYQGGFSGTSAAAAIVAGVAVAIQQFCWAELGFPLSPEAMRTLLKTEGTVCLDEKRDREVGLMPDLKAIRKFLKTSKRVTVVDGWVEIK